MMGGCRIVPGTTKLHESSMMAETKTFSFEQPLIYFGMPQRLGDDKIQLHVNIRGFAASSQTSRVLTQRLRHEIRVLAGEKVDQ